MRFSGQTSQQPGFAEGDQQAGPAELRAHRGLLGRAT
jgi:hypothetical protein